jgi:hypothetical protein
LSRILTVAALAVIGLLWVRLLIVQPRAGRPGPYTQNMQRSPLAGEKLAEVTGQAERLAEAARRGERQSAILQLTAGEINSLLMEEPGLRGVLEEARVSAPEVRFQPGRIITTATVEAAGAPVRVTAEGRLAARGGMLLYSSDRVRVAGLPAPRAIREAVETRIQDAFRRVERQAKARVDRVSISRDQITLHLSSRPE